MNRSTLTRLGLVALAAIVAFTWYEYRKPRFRAGEKAADFEATLIDGRKVHLSELNGKYTLLQFWGSWCGPCRAENPALADIYRTYGGPDFEIFSIGIESNPKAWRRAIQQDEMIWPYHAMESQDFKGGASKLFNIKSIPATFLLDPEGTIIGVNLAPEKIKKTLSERLAGR
ncbi:MAG: TlpA family protein disulfide reductase [Lewinellaceae bacterium]|nr:TlpA family protein disulfide reductase [Lewinellaceae bacterium]